MHNDCLKLKHGIIIRYKMLITILGRIHRVKISLCHRFHVWQLELTPRDHNYVVH